MDWNNINKLKHEINQNKIVREVIEHRPVIKGNTKKEIVSSLKEFFAWLENNYPEWRDEFQFSHIAIDFVNSFDKEGIMWGKLYFSFVDSRSYKDLSGNDVKVLLVFLRHANIKTLETCIGIKKVSEICKLSLRVTKKSVQTLKEKGYLANVGKHSYQTNIRKVNLCPNMEAISE
jgi:hypothetical protein